MTAPAPQAQGTLAETTVHLQGVTRTETPAGTVQSNATTACSSQTYALLAIHLNARAGGAWSVKCTPPSGSCWLLPPQTRLVAAAPSGGRAIVAPASSF